MKYSNLKEFKKANIFGTGIPNFILKGNMTGKSYIKPIKMANGIMLANVTFSPGSRCFWHVHRATKDKWFSHLSIEVPGEECGNEWLEEVSDKDYLLLEK